MKLMDDVAGIVAARHCKTNIVTASVDAINFHDKIRKGKNSAGNERGWRPVAAWAPGTFCCWFTPGGARALVSAPLPRETGSRSLVLCPVDAPQACGSLI